jgi:hypothetical protein
MTSPEAENSNAYAGFRLFSLVSQKSAPWSYLHWRKQWMPMLGQTEAQHGCYGG